MPPSIPLLAPAPRLAPERSPSPSPSLCPWCQFFLCTSKTAWLDGKHTVFGAVTKGYETVLAIEKVGSQSGTTSKPVVIKDSGVVKP